MCRFLKKVLLTLPKCIPIKRIVGDSFGAKEQTNLKSLSKGSEKMSRAGPSGLIKISDRHDDEPCTLISCCPPCFFPVKLDFVIEAIFEQFFMMRERERLSQLTDPVSENETKNLYWVGKKAFTVHTWKKKRTKKRCC